MRYEHPAFPDQKSQYSVGLFRSLPQPRVSVILPLLVANAKLAAAVPDFVSAQTCLCNTFLWYAAAVLDMPKVRDDLVIQGMISVFA
jgi:hypothetical protein